MCLQRNGGSGERTLTGNLSCPRIPTFYPLQGPTNSNMYQHFFLLLFCRKKCAAYPGHQWGGGERTFGYAVVSPSCNCGSRMLSGLNVQGSMRKWNYWEQPCQLIVNTEQCFEEWTKTPRWLDGMWHEEWNCCWTLWWRYHGGRWSWTVEFTCLLYLPGTPKAAVRSVPFGTIFFSLSWLFNYHAETITST